MTFNSYLHKKSKIVLLHSRLLVIVFGSLFISFWTMLRFFVKPTTFDLIGQQLLTRQWLAGLHSGSTLGPTNYIWKMIIFYSPLQWLPGSPRLKLILLTLLINIVTFILIVLLLEKIYRYFFPKLNPSFYLGCLWLSLIAGAMYWIQFTNSRNLEVAGGLFFVYLSLLFARRPKSKMFCFLALYLSLLLFADPLQLYMSVMPLIIFELGVYIFNKKKANPVGWASLMVIGVVGFIGSKLLSYVVERLWNVNFINLTTHTNGYSIFGAIIHGLIPGIKQMARLYVGGYEYGRYIEALNLALVIGILFIGLYYALKKLLPFTFIYFLLCFLLVDFGFYIASGQALQAQTSRYLIMTVPIFGLFLISVMAVRNNLRKLIILAVSLVVIINVFGLTRNLISNWNTSFPKDSHLYSAIDYLQQHHYGFAYASMDTALPSDYYSNGSVNILPLTCNNGTVSPSYLFFDKSAYSRYLSSDVLVPFILDGNQISNYPSVCSFIDIESQLGPIQFSSKLSDGSEVLLFKVSSINKTLGLH